MSKHIKNIYKSDELSSMSTVSKMETVQPKWMKNNMFHFGTYHFMRGYINSTSIKPVMNYA